MTRSRYLVAFLIGGAAVVGVLRLRPEPAQASPLNAPAIVADAVESQVARSPGSGGPIVASTSTATTYTSSAASGVNGFVLTNSGARYCLLGSCGTRMEISGTNQINFLVAGGESFRINGANNSFGVGSHTNFHDGTPTISSGFGTSPSVTVGNAIAFRVNVGTGGVATSGVIGLPSVTTGWNCQCTDLTTQSATVFLCKQTASSTTSATIGNFDAAGAAAAWVASDILAVTCTAVY